MDVLQFRSKNSQQLMGYDGSRKIDAQTYLEVNRPKTFFGEYGAGFQIDWAIRRARKA